MQRTQLFGKAKQSTAESIQGLPLSIILIIDQFVFFCDSPFDYLIYKTRETFKSAHKNSLFLLKKWL